MCSFPGQEGAAWTGFEDEDGLGWSCGGKFEATSAFLLGWGRLFMVPDQGIACPPPPHSPGGNHQPFFPAAASMRLRLSPHQAGAKALAAGLFSALHPGRGCGTGTSPAILQSALEPKGRPCFFCSGEKMLPLVLMGREGTDPNMCWALGCHLLGGLEPLFL